LKALSTKQEMIWKCVVFQQEELRQRTKKFAIRVVKLYRALPKAQDAQVLGKQVLRSGTAVAANYRAACRSRSRAEWIAKIGLVVEEADETLFWLEMLVECGVVRGERLNGLMKEADELTALFTASHQTAKRTAARR
jgi:four helix bundle protein